MEEDYPQVSVQLTHLLYGYEYDKIKAEIVPHVARFDRLVLGKPFLADAADLQAVGQVYPAQEGEVLLLMGRGTEHFADIV